jgi:hypothetical protein
MRRSVCLFILSVVGLAGCGSSPVPFIGVTCSNDLDGSDFGFTLTVPSDFSCIEVFPQEAFIVSDRFRQAVTDNIASIVVAAPSEVVEEDGLTIEELGSETNPNGVTARRLHIVAQANDVTVYSYVALIELPSGNELSITLANDNENDALLAAFDAIWDTVDIVGD